MAPRAPDPSRTLVLWCPDWPVVAALREQDCVADAPAVVFGGGRVQVASAAARAEGIRVGMRKREAQSRCPDVLVLAADPDRDARLFEPVALAVEELAPGIEVLRPGLLACRVRGPARYFGSETVAAERMVDAVEALNVECRVGIAGRLTTAVLAARRSAIVRSDDDADFCAQLLIAELIREPALARPSWTDLIGLLRRLGITTAGALVALPEEQVAARFGADGVALYRLAAGKVEREVSRRRIGADPMVEQRCDPPLDRVDTAAFVARTVAERFHTRLAAAGVVCTRLAITATTESGEELHRVWRCMRPLSVADTADRLRWQLDGWLTMRGRIHPAVRGFASHVHGFDRHVRGSGGYLSGPVSHDSPAGRDSSVSPDSYDGDISYDGVDDARPRGLTLLRLEAIEVMDAGQIQYGLWGSGGLGEDRARTAFARVQGLLGPDAVRSAILSGGRGPTDRITTAAWGEQNKPARDPDAPWPGALPTPSPAAPAQRETPPTAAVTGFFGRPVAVTDRGMLTEAPAAVEGRRVLSWAGPWLLDERWWTGAGSAGSAGPAGYASAGTPDAAYLAAPWLRARMQVVTESGPPVLLGYGARGWQIEAVYD